VKTKNTIVKYSTQKARPLQRKQGIHRHRTPLRYRNAARGGPSHSHRGSVQKIREDRSSGSRDMLADRQAHRQTDRNTSLPYRGGVMSQNG